MLSLCEQFNKLIIDIYSNGLAIMAALMLLMFAEERLPILARVSSRVGRVKYNLLSKCLCLIIFFNRWCISWNVEQQHLIATGLFINCTLQSLLVLLSQLFADAHYQFDCHFGIFCFSATERLRQLFVHWVRQSPASTVSRFANCDCAIEGLIEEHHSSGNLPLVWSSLVFFSVFCRYRKSLSAVICANLHGQWSQAGTHRIWP